MPHADQCRERIERGLREDDERKARIGAKECRFFKRAATDLERSDHETLAKRGREGEGRAAHEDTVMDEEQDAEPDDNEGIPLSALLFEDMIGKRCNRK